MVAWLRQAESDDAGRDAHCDVPAPAKGLIAVEHGEAAVVYPQRICSNIRRRQLSKTITGSFPSGLNKRIFANDTRPARSARGLWHECYDMQMHRNITTRDFQESPMPLYFGALTSHIKSCGRRSGDTAVPLLARMVKSYTELEYTVPDPDAWVKGPSARSIDCDAAHRRLDLGMLPPAYASPYSTA